MGEEPCAGAVDIEREVGTVVVVEIVGADLCPGDVGGIHQCGRGLTVGVGPVVEVVDHTGPGPVESERGPTSTEPVADDQRVGRFPDGVGASRVVFESDLTHCAVVWALQTGNA